MKCCFALLQAIRLGNLVNRTSSRGQEWEVYGDAAEVTLYVYASRSHYQDPGPVQTDHSYNTSKIEVGDKCMEVKFKKVQLYWDDSNATCT